MAFLNSDGNDQAPQQAQPAADSSTPNFDIKPPQYNYVEKGFGEGLITRPQTPKETR